MIIIIDNFKLFVDDFQVLGKYNESAVGIPTSRHENRRLIYVKSFVLKDSVSQSYFPDNCDLKNITCISFL